VATALDGKRRGYRILESATMDLKQLISEQRRHHIDMRMRRDLHRIPETGFKEQKTSAYVARCLREEGLRVRTGIAQTGLDFVHCFVFRDSDFGFAGRKPVFGQALLYEI
jgi:hypothetical protein